MEPSHEAQNEIGTATLEVAETGSDTEDAVAEDLPDALDSETSTMMLRRCTALAARARVDLLSPSRCGAADELVDLLARMESWDPAALEAPDPTMTVLAAAALQDLTERLRVAELQQESHWSMLITSTDAVLAVLRGIMAGGALRVPA
ncbi:hypothetical protein CFK39_00675 [Brachybacterium avium]|uniref:Uncharacterized protein n=1 Tax=Brachybacterium avium TaxID=2017485 RepID=A0A220U998_9MICO|nr:hypothetical protein [Brachybacterium avium]ASK64605.1 hypothetical protein CFK39_00675 [Brachybacterium avium]